MPRKKRYARIAITLPSPDLAAADRLARAQDRSRSWIVAEAIRQYAATKESSTDTPLPPSSGLGTLRIHQLARDLALTPEQRVREADETLRLTLAREPARVQQLLAFDRYEDYLDWKYRRDFAA
jgi:hypothetical protein